MKPLLFLLGSSLLLTTIAAQAIPQTYDETFAQTAVIYSEAAFCEKTDLDNWQCGMACDKLPGVTKLFRTGDEANGVFGYVAYNAKDNMIIVAFRGSDNIANWISNIDFFMTPYKGDTKMQVHRGFYAAYNLVS